MSGLLFHLLCWVLKQIVESLASCQEAILSNRSACSANCRQVATNNRGAVLADGLGFLSPKRFALGVRAGKSSFSHPEYRGS